MNEYYNKTSMEQASIAPRQVEEYFKDVNKIEDYDQIIIDAKKKHIILLISNS